MNEKLRSLYRDYTRLLPTGNESKQNTWFRKVMQRPQRSRHTRTKRGRK